MIQSHEIIRAMILEDMSHHTFKDRLLRFNHVDDDLIQDFIENGVEGKFQDYVALALKLKTTEGWKPVKGEVAPHKPPRSAPKDITRSNVVTGAKHWNYTNGSSVAVKAAEVERAKRQSCNIFNIKAIVEKLGGDKVTAKIMNCSVQTVRKLHVRRHDGVYIPKKYIGPIYFHAHENDIDIIMSDMMCMLPVRGKSDE